VPGIGERKDVYIIKGLNERKVKILLEETGRSVKSFYHTRSAAIHYFERKFKKPCGTPMAGIQVLPMSFPLSFKFAPGRSWDPEAMPAKMI
jgi:hypothetical protein